MYGRSDTYTQWSRKRTSTPGLRGGGGGRGWLATKIPAGRFLSVGERQSRYTCCIYCGDTRGGFCHRRTSSASQRDTQRRALPLDPVPSSPAKLGRGREDDVHGHVPEGRVGGPSEPPAERTVPVAVRTHPCHAHARVLAHDMPGRGRCCSRAGQRRESPRAACRPGLH